MPDLYCQQLVLFSCNMPEAEGLIEYSSPRHMTARLQTILPRLQTAQGHDTLVLRLIFAQRPAVVVCLVQVQLLAWRDCYCQVSTLLYGPMHVLKPPL